MLIYLKLENGVIRAASFLTYGCPPAIAAGSVLTEAIVGRTVGEAAGMTAEDLTQMLGGLPLGKGHCAALAIDALRDGILRQHQGPARKEGPGPEPSPQPTSRF